MSEGIRASLPFAATVCLCKC